MFEGHNIDFHIKEPITVNLTSQKQLDAILSQLAIIRKTQETIMSQISDFAAKEKADYEALNSKLDSVIGGIATLDALIQGFQNSPGTLSAADQAALDAISNSSSALVAKASTIDTTAPHFNQPNPGPLGTRGQLLNNPGAPGVPSSLNPNAAVFGTINPNNPNVPTYSAADLAALSEKQALDARTQAAAPAVVYPKVP